MGGVGRVVLIRMNTAPRAEPVPDDRRAEERDVDDRIADAGSPPVSDVGLIPDRHAAPRQLKTSARSTCYAISGAKLAPLS
jgi:hypothetical protein